MKPCEIRRDVLASEGINGDVQFAPVSVLWRFPERAHLDREARAVDQIDGVVGTLNLSTWLSLTACW